MTYEDVENLTIGKLENLYDGISKNNSTGNKESIDGLEAIDAMKQLSAKGF